MKTVMVSGNFDPFHYVHLEYIKKASELGDCLICVVSSDKQVIMKKGKVNEPELERVVLLRAVLMGLGINHSVYINHWDKGTALVTEALSILRPTIFCRGTDKTIEDMPVAERIVCDELGIEIIHIEGRVVHGSEMT